MWVDFFIEVYKRKRKFNHFLIIVMTLLSIFLITIQESNNFIDLQANTFFMQSESS
jgi:hypothetical protein